MRALTPWIPFGELTTLHRDIDSLFSRFFSEDEFRWARSFETRTTPAVESFLPGGELVVRADLPGINPKNVELAVEGDRLTIRGERKTVDEKKRAKFYREVSYGRFERTVVLPIGDDPDAVRASRRCAGDHNEGPEAGRCEEGADHRALRAPQPPERSG